MQNYTPEQREWLWRRKMKTTAVMLFSFILTIGTGIWYDPDPSLLLIISTYCINIVFVCSLIYLLMLNSQ